MRIEQMEYDRITEELSPRVDQALDSVSPLVPGPQRALVVLGALVRQAARCAQSLGMTRQEFVRRVDMLSEASFQRRVPQAPGGIVGV
jgi:hypothetical protein